MTLSSVGAGALGAVDLSLLLTFLIGSIPGLYVGTRWASLIRDDVLRPVIATFLLIPGLGFSLKELI